MLSIPARFWRHPTLAEQRPRKRRPAACYGKNTSPRSCKTVRAIRARDQRQRHVSPVPAVAMCPLEKGRNKSLDFSRCLHLTSGESLGQRAGVLATSRGQHCSCRGVPSKAQDGVCQSIARGAGARDGCTPDPASPPCRSVLLVSNPHALKDA